ncbi:UMP kinase [bacterium]|nr:UMP kinase [bacterium]
MDTITIKGLPVRRILLKLSGEVLAGGKRFGYDQASLERFSCEIRDIVGLGLQVGIVLGGGNIWRGSMGRNMERCNADSMGMLATIMNGLALQDALAHAGVQARVQTSIAIPNVAEYFVRAKAVRHLDRGLVVIFAGGTGNPYFTTDTAASLRALEINADLLIKATKVDGVYDADPVTNPQAKRFDRLTYQETLQRGLKVMDASAISMCMDNKLPVVVFDIVTPGNLLKLCSGEDLGTIVTE